MGVFYSFHSRTGEIFMKTTGIIPFALGIAICASMCACASNSKKTSQEAAEYDYESTSLGIQRPEPTEDYLGDLEPVMLDPIYVTVKSFGAMKPKEITKVHLVPRKNTVELRWRSGINTVCLILTKQHRDAIFAAAERFEKEAESGMLKNETPSSKNAYWTGKCSFWCGAVNETIGCENCDITLNPVIENRKAYLLLRIPSTRATSDPSEFSPKTYVYFSPAQLEHLQRILSQSALESVVAERLENLYVY
jgi:hypothetical protein